MLKVLYDQYPNHNIMARLKMNKDEQKSKVSLNINETLLSKIDNILEKGDKRSRLIERLVKKYIEDNEYKLNI